MLEFSDYLQWETMKLLHLQQLFKYSIIKILKIFKESEWSVKIMKFQVISSRNLCI